MKHSHPRRRLLHQLGGVLVWGLGVSTAFLGAVLVLLTVTQRFQFVHSMVDWTADGGDFPWLGAALIAVAMPFVAFILHVWARIAFGSRARPAR